MLTIVIKGEECFNEATQTFSTVGDVALTLEHSLVSLSKWEAIHHVPFLTEREMTSQQVMDYIACMIITPGVPLEVLFRIDKSNIDAIQEYIDSPQSATTFNNLPTQSGRREMITSELIYYWMTQFQIPQECETWHLNRLFSLIKIANIKQQKPKKVSASEAAAERKRLNEERRKQYNTRG